MDNYDGYVKIGTKIDDKDLKPQLQKTKTNILSTMKTIGIGTAVAAAAVAGFVKIAGELNKAYMVQASAERALATAAKNNPYLNDRSIQNLKAYASELQKVSNYGDEVTIGLMAQLAAAGRTEAEIQKIIKASADLAASGTTTFDGAVRNLNKTFSGLSGELGEVIPELKNLTAEQMKNGDAVDLIAKKYEGMAAAVVDPTIQAKNATGDLAEALGGALNPAVNLVADSWAKYAGALADVINKQNTLRDTVKAYNEGNASIEQKIYLLEQEAAALKEMRIQGQVSEREKEIQESLARYRKVIEAQERQNKLLAEGKEKEAAIAAEEAKKLTAQQKIIDARIEAQRKYEETIIITNEKIKGGLITQEEGYETIQGAAETHADTLLLLGYRFGDLSTIGGRTLKELSDKFDDISLKAGLLFGGTTIGGEGATGFNNIINGFTSTIKSTGNIFLNSIKKVIIDEPLKAAEEASKEAIAISARATAEAAKQTASKVNKETANIAKIYKDKIIEATEQIKQLYEIASAAMADGNVELYQKAVDSMKKYSEQIEEYKIKVSAAGRGAVNSIESAFSDNVNSAVMVVKDFTKNVAGAFSAGLGIAKNIVAGIFTAIKALATFSPKEIIDDIKKTIEGLTEFFTVELPLLPVYFASGATIIREFLRGMIEGLPNTVETIKNVLSEIFENIKENIEEDATSALTVASSLLLAIVSALPDAVIAIGQVATGLVNAITAIAPELIKGLVSGIIELLPVALDMIIDFLDSWYDTLPDLVSGLVDAIVDLIPDLVSGLISILPKLLMMMNPFNLEIIALWFEILLKILPSLFLLPINIWAGILEGIANIMIDIIDGIVLFLTDPEEWLRVQFSFVESLVNALIAVPEKVIGRISEVFKSLGGKISELISSALKIEPVITTPQIPQGRENPFTTIVNTASSIVSSAVGWIEGLFNAEGTDYYRGGKSIINEQGAELVTLPTGAKVATANATAGLVEQAVQSVMRGLGGFEGQQNQRPIVLHNYMQSVMNVNGKVLGKIAFENIDRNVRMQYGS